MPNNYVSLVNVKGENYSLKDTALHNTLGAANGIATLDGTGKVPTSQLPTQLAAHDEIIGENLIPYPYNEMSKSLGNVDWNVDEEGIVTGTGVANADSGLYLSKNFTLEPGTYTLSGCPQGGESNTHRIQLANSDYSLNFNDFGKGVSFTLTETTTFVYFRVFVKSGVNVNELIFKPMLEVGSTAHKYQPYNLSRQKLRYDIDNIDVGPDGSVVTVTQSLTTGTKVGTITVDGTATVLYAPTDTDTKVKQINSDLNNDYRVLLSNSANNIDETNQVRKSSSFTANPNTGAFYAGGYDRNDITGKTIDVNTLTLSTGSPHCMKYIEKTDGGTANITNIPVTGKAFLLDVDLIRWASTTDYITRQIFTSLGDAYVEYIRYCNKGTWGDWSKRFEYTHPSYTARTGKPTGNQTPAFGGTATVSQVTSDAIGHVTGMTDRTITIPSTLSNGTGTAGLIKTSSTVTSNSGYTACPVISGVPYYKDTDTTYSVMTGASSSAAGKDGLVPAPAAGAQSKFLRGDGTWQTVSGSSVSVVNNLTSTSTTAALSAAQGKALNEKIDGARNHAYSLIIDQTIASTSSSNYTTYNNRSFQNYDVISLAANASKGSFSHTLTIPVATFRNTGYTFQLPVGVSGSQKVTVQFVNNTTISAYIDSGTAYLNIWGMTIDNVAF